MRFLITEKTIILPQQLVKREICLVAKYTGTIKYPFRIFDRSSINRWLNDMEPDLQNQAVKKITEMFEIFPIEPNVFLLCQTCPKLPESGFSLDENVVAKIIELLVSDEKNKEVLENMVPAADEREM